MYVQTSTQTTPNSRSEILLIPLCPRPAHLLKQNLCRAPVDAIDPLEAPGGWIRTLSKRPLAQGSEARLGRIVLRVVHDGVEIVGTAVVTARLAAVGGSGGLDFVLRNARECLVSLGSVERGWIRGMKRSKGNGKIPAEGGFCRRWKRKYLRR